MIDEVWRMMSIRQKVRGTNADSSRYSSFIIHPLSFPSYTLNLTVDASTVD
mgnify:CR=1 FL=1